LRHALEPLVALVLLLKVNLGSNGKSKTSTHRHQI
jgi:hypothetical protein